MTEEPKLDAVQLQAVADATQQVADTLAAIAKDAGVQLVTLTKQSEAQHWKNWVIAVSLVLDVLFSVLVGLGFLALGNTTDRVDRTARALAKEQLATRQQVLCPLYTVLRDSRSAKGRAAAADPEKYDHAFYVIEQGYKTLACAEFNRGNTS